jgi:beta-N-acetylhexosaminidase
VAITDSLGMGAVASSFKPAVAALNAGADLLLMPVDTVETHRVVTKAIDAGEVDRARVEEAAARVVAVQLWQQRAADQAPVPADLTTLMQDAAAALTSAAY